MALFRGRAGGAIECADQPPAPQLPPSCAPAPTGSSAALPDRALNVREAERETAISQLFELHYASMLRLAALLGAEEEAEDIVAEAFCELHRRWSRLRDPEAATAYLRSTVINLVRQGIRSRRRWRQALGREQLNRVIHIASAEQQALIRDDQRAIVAALRNLPERQREALVLRYWLGLSEAEIASAMGISPGAVKSHTSRGMAGLRRAMEEGSG